MTSRAPPRRRAPDRTLCKSFDGDNVPFEHYRIERRGRRGGKDDSNNDGGKGGVKSSIRERQANFLNANKTEAAPRTTSPEPRKLRTRSDISSLKANPVNKDLDTGSSHRRDLFKLQGQKRQGSVRSLAQKFGGGSSRGLSLRDDTSTEDMTETSTHTAPSFIRETKPVPAIKTTSYGLVMGSDSSMTSGGSQHSANLEIEVQDFCKQDEEDASLPRPQARKSRMDRTAEEPRRARSKSAPRATARVHLTKDDISKITSSPKRKIEKPRIATRSSSDVRSLRAMYDKPSADPVSPTAPSSPKMKLSTKVRSRSSIAALSSPRTSTKSFKPVETTAINEVDKNERRQQAYQIYLTTGKPSKERMQAWIEYDPRRTDVTVPDLDLLPWKEGELKVDKKKMLQYSK